MTESIHDKAGREYSLEWHESSAYWRGSIRLRGVEIAYVNCLPEGTSLKIGDLHISDEVKFPPRFFQLWFSEFLNLNRPQNFRRRGIGETLLRSAIERARQHGYREVVGDVVANDVEAFPGLPDWYARMGFEVDPSGVGPIRLRL